VYLKPGRNATDDSSAYQLPRSFAVVIDRGWALLIFLTPNVACLILRGLNSGLDWPPGKKDQTMIPAARMMTHWRTGSGTVLHLRTGSETVLHLRTGSETVTD
jgi:hypothetical protein